jgi:hypothetical protein
MSPRATLAAFAVATAAVTLALGWPRPTHADGDSPLVQYMVDGTKIGDVVAKGTIVRDSAAKSGWAVVVTAQNQADHPETVPLETDVLQRAMSPMARTPPLAQNVWSRTERVTVPAGGDITRRYELPVGLAPGLGVAEREAKQPVRDPGRPILSFAVAFEQKAAPPQRRAAL